MKKLHGEMLREALRQNQKKFRKEAHFSQEQIARQLGVNRATYTYYETGKTTPSVEDLYLLSQLYGRARELFFPAPTQPQKTGARIGGRPSQFMEEAFYGSEPAAEAGPLAPVCWFFFLAAARLLRAWGAAPSRLTALSSAGRCPPGTSAPASLL